MREMMRRRNAPPPPHVRSHRPLLGPLCLACCFWLGLAPSGAALRQAPLTASLQTSSDTAAVRRILDDYIGLYTKERLTEWRALFLPGFTATYTNADGTVTSRTLDQFYESQRAGFDRAAMSETLHDVRITRDGRLAHVSAGFDFISGGTTRRGRLMLLMVEAQGQFRIASLVFTYHLP